MANSVTRRAFLGSAGAGTAAAVLVAPQPARSNESNGKKKIVAVSCSMRAGRTTATALGIALQAAQEYAPDRIETELIELGEMKIPAELAVGRPLGAGQLDEFPVIAAKLTAENVGGIIIGTPVYFANMSSLCKAFLERCGAFRKQGFALSGKVAGVLAVGGVRSGGQELTIQSVQAALLCQEMVVVGDGRPTAHFGATLWNDQDQGIDDDEFGLTTARNLGRRVAEVALA